MTDKTSKLYRIEYDYRHVPTIRKFAQDNSRIKGIMGPFGSGKSSGCVHEIIRRGHEQRPDRDGISRTRWAVIRNSYPQLRDSTIKTFHYWYPPKLCGEYRVSTHDYIITCFKNVQIEINFRALDREDQISNLLSVEYTGAWMNEAREIPFSIFEAIDGRIDRFPPRPEGKGGATWAGIIMDTNPPTKNSWWYRYFEVDRPSHARIFKQPSGLSHQAENLANLPPNYYKNLAKGKSEMYVRVYVHGQYGYTIEGKPVFPSFRDNVHVASQKLSPIKGVNLICGVDFGLCYDDQTEVLTKKGWKFFQDVTLDDLVMTKNFDTHAIEYQKPLKKIVRYYEGDMYLYENQNVNFCVTPEHIIPCRKRYSDKGFVGHHRKSAEYLFNNVTKHYAVDLTAKWQRNSYNNFGPLNWTADVFAKFMGLYLSEGSCDRSRGHRVSIAQNKCDSVFQKILDNTHLPWIRSKSGWRVNNKNLNDYLKCFGYAHEKYVPDEIKDMGKEEILLFIEAYTRGDGHIRTRDNGATEHTIFTVSKCMADDLQELALKVGWYAKIRIVKSQDSVIVENGHNRAIHNEGGYSITFKKRAQTSELNKKKFTKIPYSGKVYCLTVPNSTLYIRRKWIPSWNGNSPAIVIGQITPRGQLLVLDEVTSNGMGLKQFCKNQLLPLLQSDRYRGFKLMGYGDPAGMSRSPTDESTCYDILHSNDIGLNYITEAPTNAKVPRIGAVEHFLNSMVDGAPAFILSPHCTDLREALNGAYHYKRIAGTENMYSNDPDKSNPLSHIADALQYMCMYVSQKNEDDERYRKFKSQIAGRVIHQAGDGLTGM